MEKLKITLELTLEEARFVLNELEQFRAAKQEANAVILQASAAINPTEPKPFKLEYGKRYKRRDGKITAPLVVNDGLYSKTHPFKDPALGISWQPNGQFGSGKEIHKLDLIEEVQ